MSTFPLNPIINITSAEPISAYVPVIIARFAETVIGNSKGPIPMEKQASKMQLPSVLPIVSWNWFFLTAATFTKNSGRDVPIATAKKLTTYSDMLKISERVITDCITR